MTYACVCKGTYPIDVSINRDFCLYTERRIHMTTKERINIIIQQMNDEQLEELLLQLEEEKWAYQISQDYKNGHYKAEDFVTFDEAMKELGL